MKLFRFALLGLILWGCVSENGQGIERAPKEKIEGFSYFERETYRLQYPSQWLIIEPGKEENIEEKLAEIGVEEIGEYSWEAEGAEAAWYLKDGAEGAGGTNISLVSSPIKGLKFNDFNDKKFAEDFIDKNDEDLVAFFGTTGEMAFIEPSSIKVFDDVYVVVCKYKLYSETEDLCFYRAIFCADDSVNYFMLITGENLFGAASEQLDIMLASIEPAGAAIND
jgi:hypothetical protein